MLNASQLNRIRLTDVSWEAESEEALEATIEKFENAIGMDANENNIGKPAVVAGRVKIDSISDELYNRCYESFPNLIIDDGSGTPYIINFLNILIARYYKEVENTSLNPDELNVFSVQDGRLVSQMQFNSASKHSSVNVDELTEAMQTMYDEYRELKRN
jgi:hypothetical protein